MVKLKALFSFFLAVLLLISVTVSVSAATYTPYSGLTDTSSQASLLYGYYKNLDDFVALFADNLSNTVCTTDYTEVCWIIKFVHNCV